MDRLAIFDFDHSLIDDNSDTLVVSCISRNSSHLHGANETTANLSCQVEQLRPDLAARFTRHKKGDRWTELMDSLVIALKLCVPR